MNNENNGRGGPLDLLLAFYIYNFIGWMGESTYCSLGDGEFVNRGFLVGPQVPLYGSGAMLLVSGLIGFALLWRFGGYAAGRSLLCALAMAVTGTLAELLSPSEWDTVTVPVTMLAFALIIL